MATTWQDIVTDSAMVIIDDVRLADELTASPARFFRKMSEACGIFLDQGSNLCPLLWHADSYNGATREAPEQVMTFDQQLGN